MDNAIVETNIKTLKMMTDHRPISNINLPNKTWIHHNSLIPKSISKGNIMSEVEA